MTVKEFLHWFTFGDIRNRRSFINDLKQEGTYVEQLKQFYEELDANGIEIY